MAGGYLAGLTKEDYERALAASRSGALRDLEEPTLPEPPIEPQQARELPQNPYPEEPPAQEPVRVERARGSAGKKAQTYRDQSLDTMNERLGNAEKLGDKQGIDSRGHSERATLYQDSAQGQKSRNDEAESFEDRGEADRVRWRAEAERLYEEMSEHAKPPAPSTYAKVMGVVGAIAGMKGGKGAALANGLSALAGNNQAEWASEQAMRAQLYDTASHAANDADAATAHKLDRAQRIGALRVLELEQALGAVAEQSQSRTVAALAREGALALKQDYLTGAAAAEEQKARAGVSAQRKAAEAAERDGLERLTPEQIAILAKNGGGELAKKVHAENLALSGKELDNEKKSREAGGAGSEQEILPGLVATVPLEKATIHDVVKNAQVTKAIEGKFRQLSEIYKRNEGNPLSKWTNKQDAVDASDTVSALTGMLNQYNGRGAPNDAELDDMRKNLPDPTDNYVLSNPGKIYDERIRRLKISQAEQLQAIGIVPKEGGKPAAQSSAPRYRFTPDAPAPRAPAVRGPQLAGVEMGD